MFVLTSDITIGDFRVSGVNMVRISRSIHSISERAVITLPSVAKIVSNGKILPGSIVTGKQFNDGDPVTIKLGYNNELQTEFRGFVKRRNLKMPLEVECEGYSWLLRRNSILTFKKAITLKELLNIAVSGIDSRYKITVQCDLDLELSNVVINNESGFDIIDNISKYTDQTVSCFFIQPDVLWCGLCYTQYGVDGNVFRKDIVRYRLGYNVLKENTLNERGALNDPVQVKYTKTVSDGTKVSKSSDVFKNYVRTHSKILNRIKNTTALKQLANEKAYQLNYTGYEGCINTFLQPYAEPGYEAYITDDRYPERNGKYLIESTEVVFGVAGARRTVEIGPQSAQ